MSFAIWQLAAGSSAIRYCSLRSSTFPFSTPAVRARNLPLGVQKLRPILRLVQAPIRAGEVPA